MGIFERFKSKPSNRVESEEDAVFDALRGIDRGSLVFHTGSAITRDTAASWSAVFRAITLVAGTTADSIVESLRVVDKSRQEVKTRETEEALSLLQDSPDDMQSSHQFLEELASDYLASGNAIVRVVQGVGRRRLELLQPNSVDVRYTETGDTEITGVPDSTLTGTPMVFSPKEIAIVRWPHLAGRGFGLSPRCRYLSVPPIQSLGKIIDVALHSEEYARRYFDTKKGASNADFAWIHNEDEDPTQVKNAIALIASRIKDGSRWPLPLPGGQIVPLPGTPADGDLMKLREFQISEIARVYGIPSALLGKTDGGNVWGSSLAELARMFRLYGTRLHINRMLASLSFRLLPRSLKFEIDDLRLVRGDIDAISKLMHASKPSAAAPAGILSKRELRRLLGFESEYVSDWETIEPDASAPMPGEPTERDNDAR